MKKIIFVCLIFIAPSVSASELIGFISTNPNIQDESRQDKRSEREIGDELTASLSQDKIRASDALIFDSGKKDKLQSVQNHKKENTLMKEVLVLGFSRYPDNSLVRGTGGRIFLIRGESKRHIRTLKELVNYKGQVIFDVSDEYLGQYKNRDYLNGDLIRAQGDVKIFHIVNDKLQHVLNLEDLRQNFAGQEIFNVPIEEILLYRDS